MNIRLLITTFRPKNLSKKILGLSESLLPQRSPWNYNTDTSKLKSSKNPNQFRNVAVIFSILNYFFCSYFPQFVNEISVESRIWSFRFILDRVHYHWYVSLIDKFYGSDMVVREVSYKLRKFVLGVVRALSSFYLELVWGSHTKYQLH